MFFDDAEGRIGKLFRDDGCFAGLLLAADLG
jgi:hypothetical protein